MGQNWIELNGVKMNIEIADYISRNSMVILFHEDDGDGHPEDLHVAPEMMTESHPDPGKYPWVAYFAPTSCACITGACSCPQRSVRWRPLHLLVWDFFCGTTNPRKSGEVVHHLNQNKLDARIKNLSKGSRHAHGLAHKVRRQRFSRREKTDFGGFRFRPPLPAKVVSRPELVGTVVPIERKPPRVPSKALRLKLMEARLGDHHVGLSNELRHLDSGASIRRNAPRAAWQAPRTRMLGLKMPRLDPTPGEAGFVLLLVKHVFDIEVIARETGEQPEMLRLLLERPAVDEAIRRWRIQKRLPLVG